MLAVDEAYNARDAAQLLRDFKITPFFPDNNGRESAYHYWLLPFLAATGKLPIALRLGSTTLGILTVAALYALGKRLFDERTAAWSSLTLAVLFWHVHMSQLGLRAIIQPLIGIVAFVLLLQALSQNRWRDWIWGGLLTGSLIYTYFSARLWILFIALWLGWLFLREADKRKGIFVTGIVALIVMVPQFAYTFLNPAESLGRMQDVATIDFASIANNIALWSRAWFHLGDDNVFLNLSNRPILDLQLGALCLIGVVHLLWKPGSRRTLLWLLGLLIFSLLPSILSDDAPHSLRAIGAVIPLALLIGNGAAQIDLRISHFGWLISLGLLLVSTVGVVRDQKQWLAGNDRFTMMEMTLNSGTSWILENSVELGSVYFSPYIPSHPNVEFNALRLEEKATHVAAFSPTICVVIPDGTATYVIAPLYLPGFFERMQPWSDLTLLHSSEIDVIRDVALFKVYQGHSRLEEQLIPVEYPPVFIDTLELRHAPLPQSMKVGSRLTVALAFRATSQLPATYSAFIHLQGDPSPYEGGVIWAQADSWLCEPYQSPKWRSDETIIQYFDLEISAETPPGHYDVAVGIYESPAGSRIELTEPAGNLNQFVVIGTIELIE